MFPTGPLPEQLWRMEASVLGTHMVEGILALRLARPEAPEEVYSRWLLGVLPVARVEQRVQGERR